jgi:hypothetical protein
LTLLLVLTFHSGIEGVAWGTFVPRVVFAVLCGSLAMRWVGLSPGQFVRELGVRWLVLTAGFVAVCLMILAVPVPPGWAGLAMQILSAVVLYVPLAWYVAPSQADRRNWESRLRTRLRGVNA